MLLRTLMRPTFAPSDGQSPAPASLDTPETPTPEPETPSPASLSTPEAPSPSGEDAAKPEPTAEETAAAALEAARAVVPEEAAGYAINLSDEAKAALRLADDGDPIVQGIRDHFKAERLTQGDFDDFLARAGKLAEAGLFDTGFDVAAEAVKLGENAEGRRREVEVFANALKEREGFDEEMHGELMSLSPSAAGVRLVEFLRKQMGAAGEIVPPTATSAATGPDALMAKYREMRADPQYESDRKFRAEADGYFQQVHRKT